MRIFTEIPEPKKTVIVTEEQVRMLKEATQMSEELFDIMNEYVPEGHYFGAHPGDGSDYGVWANDN